MKILSYDESTLKTDDIAGYCACCEHPVTQDEETLVDEFWREITDHPDPDIYIDLIIDCVNLSADQFNCYHEPLLCLNCLKGAIHRELDEE